jgi:hypothetical protein
MGFPVASLSYSGRFFFIFFTNSRIWSTAPGGRSWASPPGRMYAWFILRPVMSS